MFLHHTNLPQYDKNVLYCYNIKLICYNGITSVLKRNILKHSKCILKVKDKMNTDTTDAASVSVVCMEEIKLRLNVHCSFFYQCKASAVFYTLAK